MQERLLLLWVLALPIAATTGAEPSAPVVARWRGGELTQELFHSRYDTEGQALARGGSSLDEALCKAVFQEIYVERALSLGLDRSAEVVAELASWRERNLAAAWRRAHQPDFAAAASPEALRAFWAERAETTYRSAGQADAEVLFLKCNLRPAERAACREEAVRLDVRLAGGEPFSALVAEAKQRGSEASGRFTDLQIGGLIDELAMAVASTPVGQLSAWVEMPHGLFRFHVLGRTAPAPHPFEQIEGQVRLDFIEEKARIWLEEQKARLGVSPDAAAEPILAAAAIREGLDREPAFRLKEESFRSWLLADEAFYRDEQLWPTAEQLSAARRSEGEKLARLRLLVAILPTQADRMTALANAGRLAEQLASAERPLELLAQVPERFPGARLEQLELLKHEELRPLPLLYEATQGLRAGSWRGPVPLPVAAIAPALTARSYGPARSYKALTFIGVLAREEPSEDELRRELMRQLRWQLSGGADTFLDALGARWQIELLPPAAATGP